MIKTDMIRPFWEDKPELQDVTVLICTNKNPDLIRLSLESLLFFYPTIPIMLVNGTPDDEAGRYIKYKASQYPNITVWDRVGYDSHGVAMHEATMKIETDYILTLDSDVIIKKVGLFESLRNYLYFGHFAAGMLMTPSRSGDACKWAENAEDELRYIHPSTCLFNRNMYIELLKLSNGKSAFTDHGAPSVYTFKEAEKHYEVHGFNVADYVMHLSGASWTSPRTVWSQDNGVMIRPLVTFISDKMIHQSDTDFNIHPFAPFHEGSYVIHGKRPATVSNELFKDRLRITGDYVCIVKDENVSFHAVEELRRLITKEKSEFFDLNGLQFFRRDYYQSNIAWL